MPTLRQKKAIENVVENGGNVTRAMIDAGYSPASANNPQVLTKSKAWTELMDEYLSDDLLAEKHQELLQKEEVIVKNNNKTGEIEVIPTGQIDATAVAKGLDLAYKLKGKYAAERSIHLNLTADAKDLANPKLVQVKERFEEEMRKQLET